MGSKKKIKHTPSLLTESPSHCGYVLFRPIALSPLSFVSSSRGDIECEGLSAHLPTPGLSFSTPSWTLPVLKDFVQDHTSILTYVRSDSLSAFLRSTFSHRSCASYTLPFNSSPFHCVLLFTYPQFVLGLLTVFICTHTHYGI